MKFPLINVFIVVNFIGSSLEVGAFQSLPFNGISEHHKLIQGPIDIVDIV